MSYKTCEFYSTLEDLRRMMKELDSERMKLLKEGLPFLGSPHEGRTVIQRMQDVVVVFNQKMQRCPYCNETFCPYKKLVRDRELWAKCGIRDAHTRLPPWW
jgi:hypothetical protein